MKIKETIYKDLELIKEDEWMFCVGKTKLGREIFMMLTSPQEIPFFVWDKKSGIRMDKGDYLIHTSREYNLKLADIEDLKDFLNMKNKYNITNFEYMLIVWNYFYEHKASEDLKIPNYDELPEYCPTYLARGSIINKEEN